MNVLIIDDEPLALKVLESHLKKIPYVNKILSSTEVLEGYDLIEHENIQLICLDLQMPDMTGFQFMRLLQGKAMVIITTAHQEFALEGYEHDVIDYLLKPVSFERLLTATRKALSLLQLQKNLSPPPLVPAPVQPPDFIFIKSSHRLQKVALQDILFIEGGKDYATVYTPDQKLLTLTSLTRIIENLPANRFVRVHKSYIVSLEKITSIERQRIFIEKHIIPVSDSYKDSFMQQIREL